MTLNWFFPAALSTLGCLSLILPAEAIEPSLPPSHVAQPKADTFKTRSWTPLDSQTDSQLNSQTDLQLAPREPLASSDPLASSNPLASSDPLASQGDRLAQTPPPAAAQPALIEAVTLNDTRNRLEITANGPLTYSAGWDRSTLDYRITIPNARLSPALTDLQTPADSPIRQVRLRQEDPTTVVILVKPGAQTAFAPVQQSTANALVLAVAEPGQSTAFVGAANWWRPGDPVPEIPLPSIPANRIVIVVDPGHGGSDPGAIGIGGLREVDIVSPVAAQVADLLAQQGMRVIMTRRDNRTLELSDRTQTANRAGADLFVSIHANAINLSRPDINGLETYYFNAGGQTLATFIHRSMLSAIGLPDRRVRQARFYVLRNTAMPSSLVELGFVTGAADAPRLSDPTYRALLARAIARGILEYVLQTFPQRLTP
ncbi:MAG TPA: N-acetylmuramoyl-L-alanine amidase [Chroococcidiopsis sp.]